MATWKKIVIENGSNTIAQTSSGITGVTLGALATLDTVGTSQIANDSITAAKIQDEVITYDKIAPNTIGAGVLNVSGNGNNGQILASDGDGSFSWVADSTVTVDASISSSSSNPVENHVVFDQLALKAALAGSSSQNFSANDLTVAGNLTVSGTTTTVNTANLEVQDHIVQIATSSSPSPTAGDNAGIQVETSTNEAHMPEFKWQKDKGGAGTGHTGYDNSGTSNGLTGWSVSNHAISNQQDFPIAIMDFKDDAGAPSGNSAGVGSFTLNTNDDSIYIRVA